ncbi:hypothetical protein M407DRAFT_98745 [Tulasnella calospora MUT 4182]|uniref:Uncharacterized protein n=1 Tax=Tulasnella calospora MUT 4182 TaxID=1051891 RepID=A0A0C3LTF9_9AGAM|nr:hypothetical protein M407DRAFT_98745 [Tulasnella calospora MUT 4182]
MTFTNTYIHISSAYVLHGRTRVERLQAPRGTNTTFDSNRPRTVVAPKWATIEHQGRIIQRQNEGVTSRGRNSDVRMNAKLHKSIIA